ncbi:MAG TPA: FAD:protein FMN transferase [Acidobacteriaceae bacterium]|nr:FAD:protein FMN transferase [Acidobacteriaceae bacterium]
MGTIFTLDIYARDEPSAAQLSQDAFDVIDRIDEELSNYMPSSELSRISRDAGSHPVTTDPETFAFIERSLYWSRESNGAFDITVGPLLRAWGFFFHSGRVPSDAELLALRDKIGWRNIMLDSTTRTVRFRNGMPMDLDPGSIGKGFAVDRAVARLREDGVTAALLSAGGSTLYAIGAPPGEFGWPVLVPDPHKAGAVASKVLLKDESLSTGACTEKFFIHDGHRYCHIFNPHTMRPVEGMLQTTVIDPSATDSDALSTVAFVLTPAESKEFFSALPRTRMLLFTQTPNPGCLAVHWPESPCPDVKLRPHKKVSPRE